MPHTLHVYEKRRMCDAHAHTSAHSIDVLLQYGKEEREEELEGTRRSHPREERERALAKLEITNLFEARVLFFFRLWSGLRDWRAKKRFRRGRTRQCVCVSTVLL